MKKIILCLSTISAFLFAFFGFGVVTYAEELTPEITSTDEVGESESTELLPETTTEEVGETKDDNNIDFVLDTETLEKIEAMLGDLLQGQYGEAYNELKATVGASLAVTILATLVAVVFIIRNLRKNKILKDALAKIDAETQKKINDTLDLVEKNSQQSVDYIMTRMGAMDNEAKEKALSEIDEMKRVVASSKTELSNEE